jgi:hypothetical protein
MRLRFLFPALSTAALALLVLGPGNGWAGSWFGPCCYGADYAYQYPNRAHNYFGCGPGSHCTARHPIFKHHWQRKHQAAPADGAAVNAAPFEYAPAVPAPQPVYAAPIQATSVQQVPLLPRIEPVAQPQSAGPVNATPAVRSSPGKPPF